MCKKATVVLYGLPAVGKSVVAEHLLRLRDMTYVEIDKVWSECFSNPSYTRQESQIVFERLIERADAAMKSRTNLLIEGVFATKSRLDRIDVLSASHGYICAKVLLEATLSTLDSRLKARARTKNKVISREKREVLRNKMNSQDAASLTLKTDSIPPSVIAAKIDSWLQL